MFANDNNLWVQSFNFALQENPLRIVLTNIQVPSVAETMAITDTSFSSYPTPSFGSLVTSKTLPLANKLSSCGKHTINVIFRAFDGKIESPTTDTISNNNYNPTGKSLRYDCHVAVPSTTAINPRLASSNNGWEYYSAVWTGSKVFILGWERLHEYIML